MLSTIHMLRKGEKIRGREARAWLARDGTLVPFHNKLMYRYDDASQTSNSKNKVLLSSMFLTFRKKTLT